MKRIMEGKGIQMLACCCCDMCARLRACDTLPPWAVTRTKILINNHNVPGYIRLRC